MLPQVGTIFSLAACIIFAPQRSCQARCMLCLCCWFAVVDLHGCPGLRLLDPSFMREPGQAVRTEPSFHMSRQKHLPFRSEELRHVEHDVALVASCLLLLALQIPPAPVIVHILACGVRVAELFVFRHHIGVSLNRPTAYDCNSTSLRTRSF